MKIMSIILAMMVMANASTPSHFSDEINQKIENFTNQQIQRQIENDDADVQNNTDENVNVSTTRMAYLNGNVISAQQDLIAQIENNNSSSDDWLGAFNDPNSEKYEIFFDHNGKKAIRVPAVCYSVMKFNHNVYTCNSVSDEQLKNDKYLLSILTYEYNHLFQSNSSGPKWGTFQFQVQKYPQEVWRGITVSRKGLITLINTPEEKQNLKSTCNKCIIQ
jgi:regulator of RNase E activity RraB